MTMMNDVSKLRTIVLVGAVSLLLFPSFGCDKKEVMRDEGPVAQEPAVEVIEQEDVEVGQNDVAQREEAMALKLFVDPGAEEPERVTRAMVVLHPTKGSEAMGTIEFMEEEGGVAYKASFENLPAGKHAYHIHLYGDCSSDDGKSAGTHFNLDGSSLNPPEDIDHITGDLGEVDAKGDGAASAQGKLEGASLHGLYSIIGRAAIIHEKGNDKTQPPIGAAGGRLACGVIGIDAASE